MTITKINTLIEIFGVWRIWENRYYLSWNYRIGIVHEQFLWMIPPTTMPNTERAIGWSCETGDVIVAHTHTQTGTLAELQTCQNISGTHLIGLHMPMSNISIDNRRYVYEFCQSGALDQLRNWQCVNYAQQCQCSWSMEISEIFFREIGTIPLLLRCDMWMLWLWHCLIEVFYAARFAHGSE